MPIYISQTYEVWTEDSIEAGECEDCGYDFMEMPYTFRELCEYMWRHGFIHPSDTGGTPRWMYAKAEPDYATGDRTTYALHPNNDPTSLRYWAKACTYIQNRYDRRMR